MRFAREVEELMRPYPGRLFKVAEIVRYVGCGSRVDERQKRAAQRAVQRVLHELVVLGFVESQPSEAGRGGFTGYRWKVRHAVAQE